MFDEEPYADKADGAQIMAFDARPQTAAKTAKQTLLNTNRNGKQQLPFLRLPPEVRNQIYEYLLSTEYTRRPAKSNALVVSRGSRNTPHQRRC